MFKERECFMSKAGDVDFELMEMSHEEDFNSDIPVTTENTPVLTFYCC